MKYLQNCIWLTFPPLLFNLAFARALPPAFSGEVFWRDIPLVIAVPENVLRVCVFVLPLGLSFGSDTPRRRLGIALYVVGLVLYFASWAALILAPDSVWSASAVGFCAPAYTPLVWLLGISLVGDRLVVDRLPYRWWIYALLVYWLSVNETGGWVDERTG